jgi:hypothetical protein
MGCDGKVTATRHYRWDRHAEAYRLEGVSREGVPGVTTRQR